MANKNFGNIGDVWKHVVLAEVLEREPPAWYAETHAGSGAYAVVRSGGREYGFLRFLEVAPRFRSWPGRDIAQSQLPTSRATAGCIRAQRCWR